MSQSNKTFPKKSVSFLALAATLAATCALAAPPPRVVVIPFAAGEGAPANAAAQFTGLVVEELKKRGDSLELAPAPATAPPPNTGAGARNDSASEAADQMAAGRKASDELRFEEAIAALTRGIAGMLTEPAAADFELVTDGYVRLAAAQFRTGAEKEAKETLVELARLVPSYELPPSYPPVFYREFEKSKSQVAKMPKARVSIDGPTGSKAFLNGREVGSLPAKEENVAHGAHYVRVEGAKGERFGQVVQVKGSESKVKASFAISSERAPLQAPPVEPKIAAAITAQTQSELVEYLKAANAEYGLVGYIYRTGEAQLTAGTALYSQAKMGFAPLKAVAFDAQVLTANPEAFRLVDEVVLKLSALGDMAPLPVKLVGEAVTTGSIVTASSTSDEVEAAAPLRRPVLIPNAATGATGEIAVEAGVDAVAVQQVPEVAVAPSKPVATWVWVAAGVAAAAAVGVGGYLVYNASKPVTGTVTASW